MNKVEFYNAIVKTYKSTGQGIPTFVQQRLPDPSVVDELIEEGLVKIVTVPYSTLPDDHMICLTKGYCVEEDLRTQFTGALTCLRMYLGIDPIVDLGPTHRLSTSDALKQPQYMTMYAEWLSKNHLQLEEMDKIDTIDSLGSDDLTDTAKDYLKTRSWYIKNKTISECLKAFDKGSSDLQDKISITNQILRLQESKIDIYRRKNDQNVVNESISEVQLSKSELEKYKSEVKMRAKIKAYLQKQDKNILIQNLIK